MSNSTLSESDRQEICEAMRGLKGQPAKAVAKEFSRLMNVTPAAIYTASKHVRPPRKERSDKGKRAADLMTHPKLKLFAELVANHGLKPEFAAEVQDPNDPDATMPVALGTAVRYLNEHGISRTHAARNIVPYRSWEAKAPGEIFQFDITGLKMRWLGDNKTRRMLYIDVDWKNHPDLDTSKERLWAFQIKDSYSRVSYRRFVATHKPNVSHVIDFLLEAFRELGVPLMLYTDNDRAICNQVMERAANILNLAFASSGGFRHDQSKPLNAKAHGLVEAAHKVGEEFNRLIGVLYKTPSMEALNTFVALCDRRYNNRVHRTTGVAPLLRMRDGHGVFRVAPPETLDSAFKARQFEALVQPNLTFKYDGRFWQLPYDDKTPFLAWAANGKFRANFVWPAGENYFVVWAPGYDQYTFDRVEAVADAAGDFKSLPETVGQKTRKALAASAKERKQRLVAEGKELLVPGLNAPMPGIDTGDIAIFPRPEVEADVDALRQMPAAAVVLGRQIAKWPAITMLMDEEVFARPIAIEERAWIDALYGTRETIDETELRRALETRATEAAAPEAATNVVSLMERTA